LHGGCGKFRECFEEVYLNVANGNGLGISEAVVKSDPFYPFRVLWNDKEEMKGKDQNAKKDFQ